MEFFKPIGMMSIMLMLAACGGGGGGAGSTSTSGSVPANPTSGNSPAVTDCGACSTSITLDGTVKQVSHQKVAKADGGTLTVSASDSVKLQGTTVVIPANALPGDTDIAIGEVSNSTFLPSDVLVTDIGPSGTQFDPAFPVSVSIKYDPQYLVDNKINDPSTLKVVAFDNDVAPETLAQSAIDPNNSLVSAKTTHFSRFAALGYSNASLNGYYRFVFYNYNRGDKAVIAPNVGSPLPTPKSFEAQEGTFSFDGKGNWKEDDGSINNDGVIKSLAQQVSQTIAAVFKIVVTVSFMQLELVG